MNYRKIEANSRTYTVVPDWWRGLITVLMVIGTIVIVAILALLIDARQKLEDFQRFNNLTMYRRAALDEMLTQRAKVQKWTYEQACNFAKSRQEPCLDNPQWWADPKKYPMLIGKDGPGAGLFPEEVK